VVKLAMLCGPSTRRGKRSPILISSKCGESPKRFDMIQSKRTLSMASQLGIGPSAQRRKLLVVHAALLGLGAR
jgi:hypothetical protein